MPFKGTDLNAWNKASKGKTPKQRSNLYKKYKKQNASAKSSKQPNQVYYNCYNSNNITKPSTRTLKPNQSIVKRTQPKTSIKPKINYKQTMKSKDCFKWDKALVNLKETVKDKIIDFTLDIIKDNVNSDMQKAIETYQTIEKYISIAKKIYKVVIKLDKHIEKVSIKYEEQPNNDYVIQRYKQDYNCHRKIYKKHQNVAEMKFINPKDLKIWKLGNNKKQANKLYNLVAKGKKSATSYLYTNDNDSIDEEYSILSNWNGSKQLLIQTTKISIVPFNKVTKEHAFKEGEGLRTLRGWKRSHKKFFTQELSKQNLKFTEDIKIVCEEFKVITDNINVPT